MNRLSLERVANGELQNWAPWMTDLVRLDQAY